MAYLDTVLATSGLIAVWPLTETNGTTAADAGSNGLDGAYVAGTHSFVLADFALPPGMGGSAVRLPGGITSGETPSRIEVPDNSLLDPGNVFTLEVWFTRVSGGGPDAENLVDKGVGGYSMGIFQNELFVGRSNQAFYFWSGNGNLPAPTAGDGTLHHLVWTRAGSSLAQNKLYFDGVDITPGAIADTNAVQATSDKLYFGTKANLAHNEDFAGTIAYPALYNRALSATEVEEHYNAAFEAGEVVFSVSLAGASSLDAALTVEEPGDVELAAQLEGAVDLNAALTVEDPPAEVFLAATLEGASALEAALTVPGLQQAVPPTPTGTAEDSITIRVKNPSGTWETFGADTARGIVPENVELSANEWGSDTASFDLRRDPSIPWPDLAARSPVEVEVGGVLVWSGRLKETPSRFEDGPVINVQAEGWQYHLDDDAFVRLYVHTNMNDWRDVRTFPTADLSAHTTGWDVGTDRGTLKIAVPANNTIGVDKAGAVMLDLGPGVVAKRLVFTYTSGAATWADIRTHTLSAPATGSSGQSHGFNSTSGTVVFTPSIPDRFILIQLVRLTTGLTGTDNTHFTMSAVRVFGETDWESGGQSILKASDVVRDALTHAPNLSNAGVEDTDFNIPDFHVLEPKTPREVIDAANAFHHYVTKVDVLRNMIFRPRPTAARYEIGTWPGAVFNDTSLNNAEEAYNKVIVTGRGPDGTIIRETRTAVHPVLARQSAEEVHTKILPVEAPLTTTAAQQIGDTYLAAQVQLGLKGDARITPGGVRRWDGPEVHPAFLLRETGELLRVTHIVNPNNGLPGHEGRIARVTYRHNERLAEVSLDNSRRNFEALLSRFQVVVSGKGVR